MGVQRNRGQLNASPQAASQERPFGRLNALRALAALAVLVPLLVLAAYAALSHRTHFRTAEERLVRTLDLLHEHGSKVFDTYEVLLSYADDLTSDLADAEVLAEEPRLHARLRRFRDALPQVQNIWMWDAQGSPLVSTMSLPAPANALVADREYFRALAEGGSDLVISDVLTGRVRPHELFFQFARARTPGPGGEFRGVIAVSVQPAYLHNYYAQTPASGLTTAALVREDGYILARFPALARDAPRRVPGSTFVQRIADSPERGIYTGWTAAGREPLLIAYRRLPHHPVYVTTGLTVSSVRGEWLRALQVPGAVAGAVACILLCLVFEAMRQARAMDAALAALTAERERREAAEGEQRRLQARDAQRQKLEALGQLAGGIAHDFNNVIQAVRSGAGLIQRRGTDPAAARLARMIEQAAERGAAVTRRLLAFARRGELQAEAVDAQAVLADVGEVLAHTLGANVRVEAVAEAELPALLADKGQLEAVLLNLATNARDAMPDGGELTLGAAAEDVPPAPPHPMGLRPGRYVRLDVSDTGVGMGPEVLARATEPFFTTKPEGRGTGLGLAMARGFAEQSGGGLAIRSAPGRGTTVSLWVPVARSGRAADEAAGRAAVAAATTVLLVDDEDLVREALAESLEERGHAVLRAKDGMSALAVLEAGAGVDVLLTDLSMPGMDGRAVIEGARRLRPGLAVVLLTGNAAEDWVPPSDGPFVLLRKPVGADALAVEVRRLAPGESRAPASEA
jgi:signal transduction histidine kinase/ActR/RegA family two-component response regulator